MGGCQQKFLVTHCILETGLYELSAQYHLGKCESEPCLVLSSLADTPCLVVYCWCAGLGQVNSKSFQLWVGGCYPVLGSMDESNESEMLPGLHELVVHLWGDDKLKKIINQRRHNSDHKL